MRNWSRFILVLVVALLLAGVLPAMAQGGRAAVTLLTPNYPIAVTATFDVVVQVHTGGLPVDAAAVYLNFDPTVFEVVRVQPGTSLPIFLQSMTDNRSGRVDFAAGQLPPAYPTGDFTLATVTLRALAPVEAGLITLNVSDQLRRTDVTFAGNSVISNATGAMVMVSRDAAPPPENVNAPSTGLVLPVEIGAIAPVEPLGETVAPLDFVLPAVAVPFSTDMETAGVWESSGGWTRQLAGGVAGADWAATGIPGTSSLRLTQPVDLSGVPGAQVGFTYRLSAQASQGQLQIRTAINNNWTPIAIINPAADWTQLVVDVSAYVGQVVQFRFVWDSSEGAVGDLWALDNLSVQSTQLDAPVVNPVDPGLNPVDPSVNPVEPGVSDLAPVAGS